MLLKLASHIARSEWSSGVFFTACSTLQIDSLKSSILPFRSNRSSSMPPRLPRNVARSGWSSGVAFTACSASQMFSWTWSTKYFYFNSVGGFLSICFDICRKENQHRSSPKSTSRTDSYHHRLQASRQARTAPSRRQIRS